MSWLKYTAGELDTLIFGPLCLFHLGGDEVNTGETSDGLKVQSHVSIGTNDLLIVCPGVLGHLVAEQWRQGHPDCQIFGQTVTTNHHDELEKLNIKPCLKGNEFEGKFSYVIFCAPPSQSSDYPGELRRLITRIQMF